MDAFLAWGKEGVLPFLQAWNTAAQYDYIFHAGAMITAAWREHTVGRWWRLKEE